MVHEEDLPRFIIIRDITFEEFAMFQKRSEASFA